MKKTLIALLLVGSLVIPFGTHAQAVDPTDIHTQYINALRTLISLLVQQVQVLQQQLADLNTKIDSNLGQNSSSTQIAIATSTPFNPIVPPPLVPNPPQQPQVDQGQIAQAAPSTYRWWNTPNMSIGFDIPIDQSSGYAPENYDRSILCTPYSQPGCSGPGNRINDRIASAMNRCDSGNSLTYQFYKLDIFPQITGLMISPGIGLNAKTIASISLTPSLATLFDPNHYSDSYPEGVYKLDLQEISRSNWTLSQELTCLQNQGIQ